MSRDSSYRAAASAAMQDADDADRRTAVAEGVIYSTTEYDQLRKALAEAVGIEDTGQPWTLFVEEVWNMKHRATPSIPPPTERPVATVIMDAIHDARAAVPPTPERDE